jgi:hypothetical protein
MFQQSTTGRATVERTALDRLESKLELAIAKQFSGTTRGKTMAKKATAAKSSKDPAKKAARKAAEEILAIANSGVKIATHVESRLLAALLKAKNATLPPEFQVDQDKQNYDFYLVELRFSILLPRKQFARFAEFGILISDDNPSSTRGSRPVGLFPAPKDRVLFSVDVEGAVGLDASLHISAAEIAGAVCPYADASADAKLKATMVLGPFAFHFRRAAIEVRGESSENILWRYNLHSELRGTNDFKSIMILKVAKETKKVQLKSAINVVPCQRSWLIFERLLPHLWDTLTLEVELVG